MKKALMLLTLILLPVSVFAQPTQKIPQGIVDFLHNDPTTHTIKPASLLKRLGGKAKTTLIDVRTPQEFAVMHPTGAINIPYDQLANHLDKIPHDGLVVTICHSGRRSEGATTVLHILGYNNVVSLSGGIKALAPAITSKSAPQLKKKPEQTSPDNSPADDDDGEEEDFGC